MELGLALTLTGLGGAFLLTAFILAAVMGNRKRRCTAGTDGVVTGIKRRVDEHTVYLHPVYEYTVGNTRYRRVGAAVSGRTPQIGAVVPVLYNPDRPKQSYIRGYDNRAYKILTIVFAVIGCIPILVCIGIALFS